MGDGMKFQFFLHKCMCLISFHCFQHITDLLRNIYSNLFLHSCLYLDLFTVLNIYLQF